MSPSSYTESWLCGPKDCQLYTRTYKADHPKAVVVFVHGFNEHIGRYEHVHSVFRDRGITVFCYDQRGFGKTALGEKKSKDSAYGKTSWKDQMADIEWAVKYARGEFGDLPTFLVGHSMGGALVLAFPTRLDGPPDSSTVALLSGIISSSPLISVAHPPRKIVRWIGDKLSNILPYKLIPASVNPSHLSHDPEVGVAYATDPLIKAVGSLRLISDMFSGGDGLLHKDFERWPAKLPILLYHGDKDEVTSYNATTEMFGKLPAEDKNFTTYPDGYHELHNEPDGIKEKVIEECISFIESHLEHRSEPEVTAKL